jgi:SAM-dependent methyltransferase|tara:strand:+ start:13870 stop:14460 length:591 start_codon:yes stop_codon:yes gene_type:complete
VRADIERWEAKYRKADPRQALQVDPLLQAHSDRLRGDGTALDLAAGACHAAVYLAKLGLMATALDCSATALSIGQRLAQREGVAITTHQADLDETPLPTGPWAVLCCLRFLSRDLMTQMPGALEPGGLLVLKTFNVHHLVKAPAFNPAYVLQPGELESTFVALETFDLSDGHDPAEAQSWIVARRPGGCSESAGGN